MNEIAPQPKEYKPSIGSCIFPLICGGTLSLLVAALNFPPGGAAAIILAFIAGPVGVVAGGIARFAVQVASASGRFQMSFITCFLMMLLTGLLLLGDLRGPTPHSFGWPIASVGYFQAKWDWNPNFLILDICTHLFAISIGLIFFSSFFPANRR